MQGGVRMTLKNIIGIDHAVVSVKDLDAAAAIWKKLGFTLSPRGTHSAKMGSGNYTIMLDPDYVELLGVIAETEHNAPMRDFLAKRGEGVERIAFTAVDSAAGAEEIRERGYEPIGPTDFERPVTRRGAGRAAHLRLPAQDARDGVDSRTDAACQYGQAHEAGADRHRRASEGRCAYGEAH
jgi:catechol 2,3-dioxygenase-like lactoylglutathione lyase family enzyme